MKHAFLVVLVSFAILSEINAQNLPDKENDTIIVWTSARKLNWSDFQQASHEGTKGAQSDIGLSVITKQINDKVEYIVYPYFYKKRSSTNTADHYVLAHEQLHFDIAELYARKMRKKLDQLAKSPFRSRRYNSEIDLIYNAYLDEQKIYDQQTGHSLDEANQRVWEDKITSELRNLSPFRSKIFVD